MRWIRLKVQIQSYCCTVLPENEEGFDSFVLKVEPFGKCEMFCRKD